MVLVPGFVIMMFVGIRGGVGNEEWWCGFVRSADGTGVNKMVDIFHKYCRWYWCQLFNGFGVGVRSVVWDDNFWYGFGSSVELLGVNKVV